MSSLENISSESVTCLAFVDSYTKKSGKLTVSTSSQFHAIYFPLSLQFESSHKINRSFGSHSYTMAGNKSWVGADCFNFIT